MRDLQVLFNLAWTDPRFLQEEPLRSLVEKGSGFTEDDKQIVLDIYGWRTEAAPSGDGCPSASSSGATNVRPARGERSSPTASWFSG